jgi:predicted membrane chloride channel (bestrophin family)
VTVTCADSMYGRCGRILADTPFPFPWAQLLTLFLVSYAISLPFMLVSFVRDVWTAGLLTFLAVLTYWSTNEVRR